MKSHNLYSQDELDFILKEAKRVRPDNLPKAGGHVWRMHREIGPARKWPRRTAGSISNKLYMVQTGRDGKPHKRPNAPSGIEGAYAAFREVIASAEVEFNEKKKTAKQDLQRVIDAL